MYIYIYYLLRYAAAAAAVCYKSLNMQIRQWRKWKLQETPLPGLAGTPVPC